MLSPNDLAVIDRDTALPELATLLDASRLAAALGDAFPRLEIGSIAGVYLRYKPGTSCLAGFRVAVDGQPVDLYAVSSVAPEKLRRRSADQLSGGPFGSLGVRLGARPILVRTFPNDPSLKTLGRLAAADRRAKPLPPALAHGAVETIRYKPERRWVARLTTGGATFALKVHGAGRIAGAIAGATRCQSRGPLQIAPLVHADERQNVVVQAWLDGVLLNDLQERADWAPAETAIAGAALAEIHRQGFLGYRGAEPATDGGLTELGAMLGLLAPHHAQPLQTHCATLHGALHELATIDRLIHGDFYGKQILLADGRAAVLDFDQARLGDPAEDLGNYRAHLLRDVLRGRITSGRADAMWTAFLDGYGKLGDDWPIRLQLFTAIGCLRLAPDPFRHREPDWAARTDELIELSVATLAPILGASPAAPCR